MFQNHFSWIVPNLYTTGWPLSREWGKFHSHYHNYVCFHSLNSLLRPTQMKSGCLTKNPFKKLGWLQSSRIPDSKNFPTDPVGTYRQKNYLPRESEFLSFGALGMPELCSTGVCWGSLRRTPPELFIFFSNFFVHNTISHADFWHFILQFFFHRSSFHIIFSLPPINVEVKNAPPQAVAF